MNPQGKKIYISIVEEGKDERESEELKYNDVYLYRSHSREQRICKWGDFSRSDGRPVRQMSIKNNK